MVNKRILLGMLVMALVFGMAVVGCNNDTKENMKENTYYYEMFLIPMVHYNNFMSSVSSEFNYTFSQIQGFRQTLRNNSEFIESNSGVSESEIKDFANQHGISGSEYTQAKNSLDSVGNLILFIKYTPAPSQYMGWIYVEKE